MPDDAVEAAREPMSRETAVFLVGQHSFDHFLMRDPESEQEWAARVDAVFDEREAAIEQSVVSRLTSEEAVDRAWKQFYPVHGHFDASDLALVRREFLAVLTAAVGVPSTKEAQGG